MSPVLHEVSVIRTCTLCTLTMDERTYGKCGDMCIMPKTFLAQKTVTELRISASYNASTLHREQNVNSEKGIFYTVGMFFDPR